MSNFDEAFSGGIAALKRRDFRVAEPLLRRAVALGPDRAEVHLRLAMCVSAPERTREAIACAETAVRLDPSLTQGYGVLSGLYQRLGRFDDAMAAAQTAIRLDPETVPAYADIVRCKRMEGSDRPFLEAVRDLLGRPGRSLIERMVLHFALGKAHDDLGEYAVAMEHFDEANRLGYELFGSQLAFDAGSQDREIEGLVGTYTREFLEARAGHGTQSEAPVFIVGMIRSGTTLLDSLLSRHPEVGSAGELKYWEVQSTRPLTSQADLTDRAKRFLDGLRLASAKGRVIDKYPLNYWHIGLIHAALPQARFIHLRRDRGDTCLSVYTTEFGAAAPRFAYRREHISHAYDGYLRLMDHWRGALPESNLFEVEYESLVQDMAGSVRGILGFLGLEWSDDVLQRPEGGGEVLTPSRWQVRQPIYGSSVGRWARYAAAIGRSPI